ncbi:MAG: hypothetical protein KF760_03580 [Candidatus Eremiobacteraeota bacterium]|nr:hypothetical protein [Candidatus Eremiobacteraeota bacterium]MCW5872297.1 hypothetical protein [Candidatus Eremiobacteraeota bacterium]
MQEDDLKKLREALESYLKLLASGQYAGQNGVTSQGDSISAPFEHLSETLQLPNQAAYFWAGKLLLGLQEVGYFHSTDWTEHAFDVPQPQLAEAYSVPSRLVVQQMA